jgi:hypothetical protein
MNRSKKDKSDAGYSDGDEDEDEEDYIIKPKDLIVSYHIIFID